MRRWVCGLWMILGVISPAFAQNHPAGPHEFAYEDPVTRTVIEVIAVAATRCRTRACPLVIAMHGLTRNAYQTRDNWLDLAETHGLLVVAPFLDRNRFPTRIYQQGGVLGEIEPAKRPYAMIDRLYGRLVETGRAEANGYVLFGHSAGAQFVHRMVLFMPEARFRVAAAANAGYYTLPTDAEAAGGFIFPYSLAGTAAGPEKRQAAFARPLHILLGDRDNDPEHHQLNKTAGARAQGPARFERGQFFFAAAEAEAKRRSMPFGWKLHIVPGVSHDNTRMTKAAAKILFGAR